VSLEDSLPPQLFEIAEGLSAAAAFSAVPRSLIVALLASTSVMLQLGQMALTMARSSAISTDQSGSAAGSGLVAPFWFTFLKQPLAVVHGGSPNCDR